MGLGAVRVPTAQLCHSGPDLGNPELVTQTEVRAKCGSIERTPFPSIARTDDRIRDARYLSSEVRRLAAFVRRDGNARQPGRSLPRLPTTSDQSAIGHIESRELIEN